MLKKAPVFTLLLIFLFLKSYSSHVSGGYFSYECLGNDEYVVTLNLFRDCSGITMPNTVTVDFTSTCGQNLNAVLDLVDPGTVSGGLEISQICTPQLPQSTCNGGTLPGNELYVYEGIVTITPPCDTWTMSWSTCCRNTTVNVPTSTADGVYLEATLNSATALCNSSASFLTPYPVYYACANQPSIINYTVAEPDNDILVYSLIGAYEAAATPLTYGAGYSGASPIPGITVDANTGEISFTATTIGNFIVALQVEEYDAVGQLLGTNFIDAQVVVQNCPVNTPPTPATGALAGIQNFVGNGATQTGPNSIDMCVGDDFCFDVYFSDPDLDIFTITSNIPQIMPTATVTYDVSVPGAAVASVCWTADPNFAGSTIVFNASDEACPTPAVTQLSVDVNINLGTFAGVDGVICGDMDYQLVASGGTIFNWSVVSGDPIVVGTNFSANPSQVPVAKPSQTTTYLVTSNANGTCGNTDTVTVSVTQNMGDIDIISTTANPTTVCMGDTSRLEVLTVQPPPICDEYNVSPIPFAPLPGAGTAVALGDDQVSGALPIGFSFEFFCNTYTDFYISSNGFITFNGGSGSGCCTGDFIPDPFDPNDIIALAWEDLDPDGYGTIEYFTTGAAPNRILVVNFIGISHFPGPGPNDDITVQALLYETSNIVEIHTTAQPDGVGTHTMGIEDATGVNGYAVPGRNSASWVANNDAWRFESLSIPADPYTYLWSPAAGLDDDTVTTPLATVFGTTDYIVTVYDADMCWNSDTVSVTATNPFGLTASGLTSSCSGVNNGGATVAVVGGVGPFNYLWPNGETSNTATGLSPGPQAVTVYDTGAGCSKDTVLTIPSSALGVTITGFSSTDATCFGFSDGTAIVTSTNGGGGLTYDWGPSITSTSAFATNVPAGQHTLVVSDVNGCQDDTTFTIAVPTTLSVTGHSTTISQCNQPNGAVSLDGVIGGSSSTYLYAWNTGQTSSDLNNVPSGSYCVTITDIAALGCYIEYCVSVSSTAFPTATVISTPATCNTYEDGTSTVTAIPIIGGSSTFTYQWDAAAQLQNSAQAINLGAGTYTVSATDGNGCLAITAATITEPTPVAVAATASQSSVCYGQCTNLSAIASGGNGGPYTYTWDVGIGQNQVVCPTASQFYQLTATDANNCPAVAVPLMIGVKPLIESTSAVNTTICDGASVDLWSFAWGGNGGPYTYTWDNGIGVGAAHTIVPSSYPNTSRYIVTISDACSPDISDTVFVSYYPTPQPLISVTEPEGCQPFTTTISPIQSSVANIATCVWSLQDGTFITDNSCGSFVHTFNNVDYYDATLSVISNDGCSGSYTATDLVRVNELPIANFSSTVDPTILDTEIEFDDESYGQVNQWDWIFYYSDGANILGMDTLQDPSFTFPVDTGYYPVYLHVTTIDGCEDDTLKEIFINGQYMFYVPNSFTPNGDGKNDIFKPTGIGFSTLDTEYTMEIFDRWGQRLYYTPTYEDGWNGKDLNGTGEYVPSGVYVYRITTVKSTERWDDGRLDTTPFEYTGHVTLVR